MAPAPGPTRRSLRKVKPNEPLIYTVMGNGSAASGGFMSNFGKRLKVTRSGVSVIRPIQAIVFRFSTPNLPNFATITHAGLPRTRPIPTCSGTFRTMSFRCRRSTITLNYRLNDACNGIQLPGRAGLARCAKRQIRRHDSRCQVRLTAMPGWNTRTTDICR